MLPVKNTEKLDGLDAYEIRPLRGVYDGIHVEWDSPLIGWGEWTMLWSDEDKKFHIYTEHMDNNDPDNREFSKAILMKILEKAVIDE